MRATEKPAWNSRSKLEQGYMRVQMNDRMIPVHQTINMDWVPHQG